MQIGRGKPKYSEKTCSSATLSTTNPTWLDPGLNPGRRDRKPATNRLSYGAAFVKINWFSVYLRIFCQLPRLCSFQCWHSCYCGVVRLWKEAVATYFGLQVVFRILSRGAKINNQKPQRGQSTSGANTQ
jgi:hypothetical protein